MARITIAVPDIYHFETELGIRITDINYSGHLGNDALLGILQECRIRFFQHFNYTEMDIGGCGIIMSDSAIIYKSEGFYPDVLRIRISAHDFTSKGFDIYYEVYNISKSKLLCEAKTGIVCFDYILRKPVNIPEEFIQKIQNHTYPFN